MLEALGFILGGILGSFVAASASRIIRKESLKGRSYCQHCKKRLRWYDLFPVFSYLILQGKCRYCKKKIPLENLIIELSLGLVVAFLFTTSLQKNLQILLLPGWQNLLPVIDLFFKVFVVTVLSIIFLVDLKVGLIPNKITYPATFLAVFYLLSTVVSKSFEPALFAFLSAAVVSLFFAMLIIITRGKGMGWGDVKFVLFLGLALGFPGIVVAIFFAFTIGATFSLVLILLRKKHFGQTIPFGPFLSLGALIYILWGTQILNWYLFNIGR